MDACNSKNERFKELTDSYGNLFNACYGLPWLFEWDAENRNLHEFIKPIVGSLNKIKKQETDETLQKLAAEILAKLPENMVLLSDDGGNDTITEFLNTKNIDLLETIAKIYPSCSDIIHENLEFFIEVTEENTEHYTYSMLHLLKKVAEQDPREINSSVFDYLINSLRISYGTTACLALQKLAISKFDLFNGYHDKIEQIVKSYKNGVFYLQLLADLSQTAALGEKYAKVIWEMFKTGGQDYRANCLSALRNVAVRQREAVERYKHDIEQLKTDLSIKDWVMLVLDVLEGRSLEKVSNDLIEQREDIDNLNVRVTNNEGKIEYLDNEVKDTKAEIKVVKLDVQETKERLSQMEYTMKGLDERVEQLGYMTLSHAPAWSRHVSDLMNNQADNDWRLLAMKLNYTNDDIRNWATQPDPCLSLLDEWFATHKTREATFAILNNLKDMNRLDAVEVVENALAAVKDVVTEETDEVFEKPEIFLSYQWGHQQEVKLLKKHLEMAGFKAWMDIGQMGGGDKLYAKIDDGVRSAKVIINCVSEKYAQSANCCREVNLSTNLGKPMIPLLMEQLSWPPPGPMGPIMSEYLYIKFFKSNDVEKDNKVFWMSAKFQELLMQLRYYAAPDVELIKKDSLYYGWMTPPEEVIVIPDRKQKVGNNNSKKEEKTVENEKSPDVFISYQWDKQEQIKRLYKKLTEMGYHCWLDIMQMGGGDSLFDKIDKGIRGAKIVVSCVTKKYALSVNCKREVSLSSALNKPIIPLLLENMSWPPEGQMSMIFTQLLYIGFHKKENSSLWQGDEFDQLTSKIDTNITPSNDINDEDELDNSQETKQTVVEAAKTGSLKESSEKRKEVKNKMNEKKKDEEVEKRNAEREREEKRNAERQREEKRNEENKMNNERKVAKKENESSTRREVDNPPPKKSSTCTIL
ncbi:DgyrCDS3184 [Dimorphilus gyrociliatus]|uniref:DgyrCDS3184 n=1 Tax=Dimorphilus gyrociliatus TaxID=2664684 RepID=A0A7I8VEB5_9ANNE|nr:DgyrCDS3184 [Dimorphilus gyrociliatus]